MGLSYSHRDGAGNDVIGTDHRASGVPANQLAQIERGRGAAPDHAYDATRRSILLPVYPEL